MLDGAMRLPLPPWPALPAAQQATLPVPLRYEDLAQDGRLLVSTLGPLYGAVAWRELLQKSPVAETAQGQGLVPILTRLVLDGGAGPFSPARPLDVTAGYQLAHSCDAQDQVARIHLQIWAEARGRSGHAYDLLASPGPELLAGRVYAEHVFTRLFAPATERKVLRLDLPGFPPVPPERIDPATADQLLALPEGAEPLGDDHLDPSPVLFSLGHTDSNQHVNSLVYPRLFEESVLRKLHTSGEGHQLLVRYADCMYRKPFFAGEAARVRLRAFRLGAERGAVGVFLPESEGPQGRPSVIVRMLLAP
ncbi:MAG: hypothetical protein MUF64_01105 [Polyangiaceae bacterium]|nr:hypothetical protein [Polyangiaceae bacterium]